MSIAQCFYAELVPRADAAAAETEMAHTRLYWAVSSWSVGSRFSRGRLPAGPLGFPAPQRMQCSFSGPRFTYQKFAWRCQLSFFSPRDPILSICCPEGFSGPGFGCSWPELQTAGFQGSLHGPPGKGRRDTAAQFARCPPASPARAQDHHWKQADMA